AGRDLQFLAGRAAEAHAGAPARDAESFMDTRMIMREGINSVAPHFAPAVRCEKLLDRCRRIAAGDIDAATIHQKWQTRIIRHYSVIGEAEGEGLDALDGLHHASSIRLCARIMSTKRANR